MIVKFNRGPKHGEYVEVLDGTYNLMVAKPTKIDWQAMRTMPNETEIMIRGEYVRSHTKLKNGAVIFEWIGWIS